MKQKFRKLTFVKVADEMPDCMFHFDKGFVGIVEGTYSQMFGGDDIKKYSLYKIEGDRVVNNISWYYESQLTELPEQDRGRAEEMIEEYNLRKNDAKEDSFINAYDLIGHTLNKADILQIERNIDLEYRKTGKTVFDIIDDIADEIKEEE